MTDDNPMFAAAPESSAAEESGRDKRTLLLAGGLGALVLGAGAFFFLGSGSSEDGEITIKPNASAASAKARAAKAAAAKQAAAPLTPAIVPAVSTFNVGRNPFTALYVPPAEAPAKAPATTTGTGAPTTGGSAPTTGGSAPTTGGSAPSTGGSTYVPPVTSTPSKPTTPATVLHKLVLQSVTESKDPTKTTGVFLIDGKKYVAAINTVFGPTNELKVVSYQQDEKGRWSAALMVGESSVEATQGEELRVM